MVCYGKDVDVLWKTKIKLLVRIILCKLIQTILAILVHDASFELLARVQFYRPLLLPRIL